MAMGPWSLEVGGSSQAALGSPMALNSKRSDPWEPELWSFGGGLPPYPIIQAGRNLEKFLGPGATPDPCISQPVH